MNAAPRAALNQLLRRGYSQAQKGAGASRPPPSSSKVGTAPSAAPVSNVTGLSSACVRPTTTPVGPGASPTSGYKVPEYFSFNRFSFAEAEVEMAKYRCPQPSALK
ncbi:NADH dehydrogenase [ubiquinone] flavoprotein 3, mitochondrial [Drosophila montana]|uniref:NADH dehydrogenase [ubiquinone] flavoprotein 3, mitochondrial n=1 Tax=Drosophila montana TaxID=40370 RepID=UPI00313BE5B9